MNRPRLLLAAILVTVSTVASAQELPPADGAWVLQLVTHGGITGTGRGNVVVTSDGQLTCTRNAEPCSRTLSADSVGQLAAMIAALDATAWVTQPPSTCSDCFKAIVTLRRREAGIVRTSVAEWDESQSVLPQLRNLSETLIVLGRASVAQ